MPKARLRDCKRESVMERKHNKNIVPIAKTLRKNMTKEKRHLWGVLLRTVLKFVLIARCIAPQAAIKG